MFLVQPCCDEAGSLIKNGSLSRENRCDVTDDSLKMQNNPSAADAKINAKKNIFTVSGGQGKIIHS